MKYFTAFLICCYTAGSVVAYNIGLVDDALLGRRTLLMGRSPGSSSLGGESPMFNLQRRMESISPGPLFSALHPDAPIGVSDRPFRHSFASSEVWPAAKASLTGHGILGANDIRNKDISHDVIPADSRKNSIHSTNPYYPNANSGSIESSNTNQRFPCKASAQGCGVTAVLATDKRPGHILLTAPDRKPKQIHVPPGKQVTAKMESDVPGGARAFVAGGKGSYAAVTGYPRFGEFSRPGIRTQYTGSVRTGQSHG